MDPEVSEEARERVRRDLEWMERSPMQDRIVFYDGVALDAVLAHQTVPSHILARIDVYRDGQLERADRQPRQ